MATRVRPAAVVTAMRRKSGSAGDGMPWGTARSPRRPIWRSNTATASAASTMAISGPGARGEAPADKQQDQHDRRQDRVGRCSWTVPVAAEATWAKMNPPPCVSR